MVILVDIIKFILHLKLFIFGILIVENESVLHQMNRFAIKAEVSHNRQYVVSVDKVLLETYLKEMQLIK